MEVVRQQWRYVGRAGVVISYLAPQHNCRRNPLAEFVVVDTDDSYFVHIVQAKNLPLYVQGGDLVSSGLQDWKESAFYGNSKR